MERWSQLPLEQRQAAVQQFLQTRQPMFADQFLSLVRAPGGYGVYASIGPNYQYAVFGRDSIAVAEDLLAIYPALTKEIILLLARLQGQTTNDAREEEPGKIHHEYRQKHFDGESMSPVAHKVLTELSPKWGGTEAELCYYGSVDATPKFIRLVGKYVLQEGQHILQEMVTGRDGKQRTLEQHVEMAVDWLSHKISTSPWQLLEFKRRNRWGLPYQAWRDSEWAYLHLDGTPANADGGIASLDVQGDAYDALLTAAGLFADNDKSHQWRQLASALQRQTIERLWMSNEQYFAMGLDRDESGNTRQIATLTSSSASLLASKILDGETQRPYVEPIVETIMSDDFITDAGVRLRARRHLPLLDFADYHGAMVTWPHETGVVIQGLHRHGYHEQASQLTDRLLHAVAAAGEFYEFFLVNQDGKVKYHYRLDHPDEPAFHTFGKAYRPEPGQAWTISAAIHLALTAN